MHKSKRLLFWSMVHSTVCLHSEMSCVWHAGALFHSLEIMGGWEMRKINFIYKSLWLIFVLTCRKFAPVYDRDIKYFYKKLVSCSKEILPRSSFFPVVYILLNLIQNSIWIWMLPLTYNHCIHIHSCIQISWDTLWFYFIPSMENSTLVCKLAGSFSQNLMLRLSPVFIFF